MDMGQENFTMPEMRKDIQTALLMAQSALTKVEEQDSRITKIEDLSKVLFEMNTNLKVMVEQNNNRDEKVEGLGKAICNVQADLKELKEKPLVAFEKGKWIVISIFITALTAFFLSRIPDLLSFLATK